jgi:hypothetical protein
MFIGLLIWFTMPRFPGFELVEFCPEPDADCGPTAELDESFASSNSLVSSEILAAEISGMAA